MKSRRFIRSSLRLEDDWRRVTRLDGSGTPVRMLQSQSGVVQDRFGVKTGNALIEHKISA
jgi:hypothetical protein